MLGRWRSAQPNSGRQTLVIQETTVDRGVLPTLLKTLGGDTACPDSPQHAAQLLEQRYFDVVVTDVNFTALSGIELIDTVRRGQGPNAQSAILVVTTDDSDELRRRAILAGADGYLIKPVLLAALRQEIASAVARRKSLMPSVQRLGGGQS